MSLTDVGKGLLRGAALAGIVALGFSFATPGAAAREQSYTLATAVEGGTFHPAGTALATVVTTKLGPTRRIAMTTVSSGGSEDNAWLLRKNQAQFALMSALIGHLSWTGQGPFEADGPDSTLRAVAALWPDVEHFVIRRQYARTGTIEDMHNLKGKPVSLGLEGSGTFRASRFLLGNLGIDVDQDYDLIFHASFTENTRAFMRGEIEALSLEAGVPASAITLALHPLGDEAVLLGFNDTQRERADGGLGLWTRYVIRAGTYPNQHRDVHTIAMPTILAVRADMDTEVVYLITKAIFENLPVLRIIHGGFKETSLDQALVGLPMPLHPGALRYYREAGLAIPANLIAETPSAPVLKGTADE